MFDVSSFVSFNTQFQATSLVWFYLIRHVEPTHRRVESRLWTGPCAHLDNLTEKSEKSSGEKKERSGHDWRIPGEHVDKCIK